MKVSCILRHQVVQLILAYSWARPAILVAGKSGGGIFLFLLFLHFHVCFSFFPIPLFHLYYLFYLFSTFLWEMTQNDPQVDVSLNPNTINQTVHHVSTRSDENCWRSYPGNKRQKSEKSLKNVILSKFGVL